MNNTTSNIDNNTSKDKNNTASNLIAAGVNGIEKILNNIIDDYEHKSGIKVEPNAKALLKETAGKTMGRLLNLSSLV